MAQGGVMAPYGGVAILDSDVSTWGKKGDLIVGVSPYEEGGAPQLPRVVTPYEALIRDISTLPGGVGGGGRGGGRGGGEDGADRMWVVCVLRAELGDRPCVALAQVAAQCLANYMPKEGCFPWKPYVNIQIMN